MRSGKSQSQSLSDTFRESLRKRELQSRRRTLTIAAPGAVDFSSNDFLSLGTSEAFRARLLHHLTTAPKSTSFASGGSRLLDGNSAYAQDLERFIAHFHHAESGLLFNSGYDANVGVLSTIPQIGDLIVFDEFVHASSRDGMRLSRAGRRVQFIHNSPESLRQVLENELNRDEQLQTGRRNVFICIESLYSMDGDVSPVRSFIDAAKSLFPHGNAYFIVDEAHATGVFGRNGVGIIQDLGVEKDIFIRIHTFGKALASHGAIVLCSPGTRDYLVNYCHSIIYTTAMGFPLLAAIRTSYEMLNEGQVELVSPGPPPTPTLTFISMRTN
ncbi:hypothetical protein KEM54_003205 [Ascosphaera aggregata]|nr:hypothetical protein KEM54_003205 [Ascosphaera aggregata]